MMKSRILPFLVLSLVLLFACACHFVQGESEELPYGVKRIRAFCVWDNNMDMTVDEGANAGNWISIAVIDTGIDYYIDSYGHKIFHPDLADNIAGGARFRYWGGQVEVLENESYEDEHGHGTHVAGIIAALDNTFGVIGAAPKAKIYALKLVSIWSPDERVPALELAAAINWSVQKGIQIISMSLGFKSDYDEVLHKACDNAYAHNVLLIAAAGNDNKGYIEYPACYSSVIAVGAIDQNDERWVDPIYGWGSHYGWELELMAPGANITSTGLNEGYDAHLNGTSYAVPHVTATAALVLKSKIDPNYDLDNDQIWDNFEVREKLKNTALDLGELGFDIYYGYGLVNAWYASQRPPGDINNDKRVNAKDAVILGRAFGSHPGDPNWDFRADISIDNNVNAKDSVILGSHFNEYWDP